MKPFTLLTVQYTQRENIVLIIDVAETSGFTGGDQKDSQLFPCVKVQPAPEDCTGGLARP